MKLEGVQFHPESILTTCGKQMLRISSSYNLTFMSENILREFLPRLVRREALSRDEAENLLEAMLGKDATDAQIAAVLVALASKGETIDELAGMTSALRRHATRITSCHSCLIDTAGTGSSLAKTFNISTAAAFVVAAAGPPVASMVIVPQAANQGALIYFPPWE